MKTYRTKSAKKALNAFKYRKEDGQFAILFRTYGYWNVLYETKK